MTMSNSVLKSSLVAYPTENWDAEINLRQFSQAQIMSVLSKILEEHGNFPVPWGATGMQDSLSVVGYDGSYVGHWNTFEGDEETG